MTRSAVIVLVYCFFGAPSVAAQSSSPIGVYLAPWGGWDYNRIAMTPDGEWIAFAENKFGCNSQQRISMMHPDGSGYFIVLDHDAMQALHGPAGSSHYAITELRIAGDASTLYFKRRDTNGSCQGIASHRYLVDVATGVGKEFFHEGEVASDISFTDDGRSMVFKAYSQDTGSWWHWRSKPDGSEAVRFLDGAPWFGYTSGIVSGDGTKFVFIGQQPPFPYPSDVYVYDFATSVVTQVSPAPVDSLFSVSCSGDGSRVIYSPPGTAVIHAVNVDGSGYHQIPIPAWAGTTETVTRDGRFIFFGHLTPFTVGHLGDCYRVAWDGSGVQIVGEYFGGWGGGSESAYLPLNADGTLYAHWSSLGTVPYPGIPDWLTPPLTLTILSPPMLTTYGLGMPDTKISWDVAGSPGDDYLLAASLRPAALHLAPYGVLGLDPQALTVLSVGRIEGPLNTGHLQLRLPPGLDLPEPIPLYSQALVQGPGGGKLTNTTTLFIGIPASLEATMGSGLGGATRRANHADDLRGAYGWLASLPPEPTVEERGREFIRSLRPVRDCADGPPSPPAPCPSK